MRSGPPEHLLASALGYRVEASAWLAGELLAASVPLVGGTVKIDTGTQEIESADLAVAYESGGRVWLPGADTQHPLARYGQELSLTAVTWDESTGQEWRTPLARLLNVDWSDDGGEVKATSRGVLRRVSGARFRRPETPARGGTFASEFRRLMVGGIPVAIDAALVDRACPTTFQWAEDRIAALYDLANAWPALIVPDGAGGIVVRPPLDETFAPALTLTDGEGGVVVSAPTGDTREGSYNGVIARAQSDDADAALVQGEAWATGAMDPTGPYGEEPAYYQSPLLKTTAQCESAAAAMLAKVMRPGRTIQVTLPVDPRIEAYDPVRVTFDGSTFDGHVIDLTIPVTAGDMSITVGVI